MKVVYLPETIDCTADPHPVDYGEVVEKALEDVLKVCESPLVSKIRQVQLEFGECEKEGYENFESDYSDIPFKQDAKVASGPMAKQYKVEGLYLSDDASADAKHHLPIGLEGVRAAIQIIKYRCSKERRLPSAFVVRLIWKFAGTGSCADNIDVEFHGPSVQVDYSNQDWHVGKPGYAEHCEQLSSLIGKEITPNKEEE